MLRTFKRVVSAMLVLTLVFSISLMTVEAKQIKDNDQNDETIQVRFMFIDYYRNNFDISSSGLSSISSVVFARNVDEIEIVGNLQQFVDGKWKTIKSWNSSTNGMEHSLEKNWYVTKGSYYRYKSYAYMYSDGTMVESTSYTSDSVYY